MSHFLKINLNTHRIDSVSLENSSKTDTKLPLVFRMMQVEIPYFPNVAGPARMSVLMAKEKKRKGLRL